MNQIPVTHASGMAYGGYAANAIFDLAYRSKDYWTTIPTVTDQTFSHNTFTDFSGYGIVLEAGYGSDGYWGSMSGVSIDRNQFDIQGPGLDNVAAIALISNNNSTAGQSSLTDVGISYNTGVIEAPGVPIYQNAHGGELSGISEKKNSFTVVP